ncbi:MAG: helix-turn-helix domain-containing protein [Treponema sp.]|jgi:DNA-binding XRE family transcriptional regulator|nr:helix-turn-helix domain-containing protein [Treponema sp.]
MGESPITLGKLIKSARLEAGLTQDNLATRVGVTSRYIMAIENENKYPSIQVLSKIICTLKISADTIFYPEMQHKTRERKCGLAPPNNRFERTHGTSPFAAQPNVRRTPLYAVLKIFNNKKRKINAIIYNRE